MLLLTATRDALLQPLQAVSGIVEKRHTLPILSNVLIRKNEQRVTFLTTDIEIQICSNAFSINGGEDAQTTVGARKLQEILRSLPDSGEVNLVLDDKKLTVKCGKSRFVLQTLPASDYPLMELNEGQSLQFQTSQRDFKKQLSLVQYAMASQDIRYYMNGMLVVGENDQLRLVATDGHRLALTNLQVNVAENPLPRTEIILPRKTVLELNRQLSDSEEPLEIAITGNQIRFRFEGIELISKLVDGKFPDYERVIPQSLPKAITLDRVTLLHAMQRAAILTNDKFRGVRIVLSDGSLKIISSNAEQEEAQEELEIGYQGDTLDVGFNVTYLLDVLNNLNTETVVWNFGDNALSSSLISVPEFEAFKYVVMPMRI